mmetsp:Transcript_43668/g.103053  ORF Transcript_43668/g.103053 Transcript_43668/m.103053 type:complete len:757 (-) Transcript_43668:77-2347(-)
MQSFWVLRLAHRKSDAPARVTSASRHNPFSTWSACQEEDLPEPVRKVLAERAKSRYPSLAIHEDVLFRRIWNWLLLLMLVYTGTVFPYRLAYIEFHMPDPLESEEVWKVIEYIIDALFWVDLVAGFFFTFRDPMDREVDDMRSIARRYLRGFFLINLISCLPPGAIQALVELIIERTGESTVSKTPRLVRIQRVSRLYKLIRLPRLAKIIELHRTDNSNSFLAWIRTRRGMRVANFITGLFWIIHILGCGWYLVASLHVEVEETWLNRRVTRSNGENLLDRNAPISQWIHSVYFVLTVFTSIGFGDITPVTEAEVVYTCCIMVVGCIVYSLVMSEMINILTSIDGRKAIMKEREKLVKAFALQFGLKEDLTTQLQKSVKRGNIDRFEQLDQQDCLNVLLTSGLSRQLLSTVAAQLYDGRLIQNHFTKILKQREHQVTPRFALRLALMLGLQTYEKKEFVYVCFDHPYAIFIVNSGVFACVGRPGEEGGCSEVKVPASVLSSTSLANDRTNENLVVKLGSEEVSGTNLYPYKLHCHGGYFGDIEVVLEMKHRLTGIRAERSGAVLSLDKTDFLQLARDYPRFAAVWRTAAQGRECHRRQMLAKLTRKQHVGHLAACIIQAWVRSTVVTKRDGNDDGPPQRRRRSLPFLQMAAAVQQGNIERHAHVFIEHAGPFGLGRSGSYAGSDFTGSQVTKSDFQALECRLQSLQTMMSMLSSAGPVGSSIAHVGSSHSVQSRSYSDEHTTNFVDDEESSITFDI